MGGRDIAIPLHVPALGFHVVAMMARVQMLVGIEAVRWMERRHAAAAVLLVHFLREAANKERDRMSFWKKQDTH